MTAATQRYAFRPISETETPHRRGGPAARAQLTEADLAAAREEGLQRGRQEAAQATDRASAEALRAIARMMQMMLSGLAAEAQGLRQDALEVAMAAAQLMAGQALEQFAPEAVEGFVSEAIGQLRDVPRLVVRIAPELADDLAPRLEQVARDAGFDGQVVVRPDPVASGGDVTLEWAEGSIHHDRASSFAAVEAAAERWLAAAKTEGFQLDLFGSQG